MFRKWTSMLPWGWNRYVGSCLVGLLCMIQEETCRGIILLVFSSALGLGFSRWGCVTQTYFCILISPTVKQIWLGLPVCASKAGFEDKCMGPEEASDTSPWLPRPKYFQTVTFWSHSVFSKISIASLGNNHTVLLKVPNWSWSLWHMLIIIAIWEVEVGGFESSRPT